MTTIKAFVAHSFSAADKDVVRTFLDHFTALGKARTGFTWDHAEDAESSPLSEKVLKKIADKNVFIGICTKNEYALPPSAVTPLWPLKSKIKAQASDAKWKASDWIIQEIGLAVGRDMTIIIFLEEGVREPGGLYGNIEYISFSRSNPHASFDKLLEMLSKLTPKEATISAGEAKPGAVDEKTAPAPARTDKEPKPSWTKDDYEHAAFTAILDDDQAGFGVIDEAYRSSPFAKQEPVEIWDARIEYFRLVFGKKADFKKIKAISEKNPRNATLLQYKARGYEEMREYKSAAKTYEEAAAADEEDDGKASNLVSAATCHAKAGDIERAVRMFESIKSAPLSAYIRRSWLVPALRTLAEIDKDDLVQLALMEQAVELNLAEVNARFSLAYQHSESGNNDMALFHYLTIPEPDRDATTWNNLGVSYNEFGMPVKSIAAFQISANSNEPLAMSNLGFRLLSAGFAREAKELCDKALTINGYPSNVLDLAKRLREVREEETNKLTETLEKVKAKAAYFRQLGEALLVTAPIDIAAKWTSPDGPLEATLNGSSVRFFGAEKRPVNALAGVTTGMLVAQKTVVHKTEYVGRLRGNAISGTVKRTRQGDDAVSMLSADNTNKVAMCFSTDRAELFVMESPSSAAPRFYSIKRLDDAERK